MRTDLIHIVRLYFFQIQEDLSVNDESAHDEDGDNDDVREEQTSIQLADDEGDYETAQTSQGMELDTQEESLVEV